MPKNKLKQIQEDIQWYYNYSAADIHSISSNQITASQCFSSGDTFPSDPFPIYSLTSIRKQRKIEKGLLSISSTSRQVLYATFATPPSHYLSTRYPLSNETALTLIKQYFRDSFGAALIIANPLTLPLILDRYYAKEQKIKLTTEENDYLSDLLLTSTNLYEKTLNEYKAK